jgi:hypothetical protein
LGFIFGFFGICYPICCGGKEFKDIIKEVKYKMKWSSYKGSFLCKEVKDEMTSAENILITSEDTLRKIIEICLSVNFALTDEQHLRCLLEAINCLETNEMGNIFSLDVIVHCAINLLQTQSSKFGLWDIIFYGAEHRFPSYINSPKIGWEIVGVMCCRIRRDVPKQDILTRRVVMKELENKLCEESYDPEIRQIQICLRNELKGAFHLSNEDYKSERLTKEIIQSLILELGSDKCVD